MHGKLLGKMLGDRYHRVGASISLGHVPSVEGSSCAQSEPVPRRRSQPKVDVRAVINEVLRQHHDRDVDAQRNQLVRDDDDVRTNAFYEARES